MPYKPTGRPVGRPLKDEARLLTYSFKADARLMEEAKEYAWRHRTSVGELIRDGLKWRLEDGDPLAYRYVAPPVQETNSNTVIPPHAPVAVEPVGTAGSAAPVPLDAADLDDLDAMPLEPEPAPRPLAQPCDEPGQPPPRPYGSLTARVKQAIAHQQRFTCNEIAKGLGEANKLVWQVLQGLVDEGTLRRHGKGYRVVAPRQANRQAQRP